MMVDQPVIIRQGDFTIRRATHSDYQAVIDIDENIYGGLDYMPLMFHQFIQSKNHVMLVTEYEGKIMGLVNYLFSDHDPQHVIRMSRRLKKTWRGMGYGESKYLDQQLVRFFPQLTKVIFTRKMAWFTPSTATALYQWTYLSFRVTSNTLSNRLANFRSTTFNFDASLPSDPRPLTYQMVDTLLTTSERLELFFRRYSDEYILADTHYQPMKINKADLKELFATASWSLITDDMDDSYDKGKQISDGGHNTNNTLECGADKSTTPLVGTIQSLSYSYLLPVQVGVVCDVFFFGSDPQQAARHAVIHAEHLVTVWNGDIGFVLHIPAELDVGPIDATIKSVFSGPAHLESMVLAFRRLPEPEVISQY